MRPALFTLTTGAFGAGVTEFVIIGLLLEVSRELNVSIAAAGLLISGCALSVTIGAPIPTALTARWLRKHVLFRSDSHLDLRQCRLRARADLWRADGCARVALLRLGGPGGDRPSAWSSTMGQDSPWCRSRPRCFHFSPSPRR